jgi:hypothetical protein
MIASVMSGTLQIVDLFGFMQNISSSDWGDGEIEILLSQA